MTAPSTAGAPVHGEAGFAAQAARLVESARANERAVHNLEEATQILAANVADLEDFSATAEALQELAARIDEAGEVAAAMGAVAEELAPVQGVAERALCQMRELGSQVEGLAERVERLDEGLGRLEEQLTGACERIGRIEAVECEIDRLLSVFTVQADAYAARVEPQLAHLQAIAERMDAPAVADELADVLAASYRVLELAETKVDDHGDR